jgi:succinate dehydrogenase flavin-adding protein (antitoxin of CptAB toxin-antitoxin module)
MGFISMIMTLILFLSTRRQSREQIKVAEFNGLVEKTNRLEIGQAEINVKLGIFWKDVSFDAAKILHRPHPDAAEMDALIDKYLAEQLKSSELKRFISLLESTRDDVTLLEGRRLAASQMLRAIKQRYELMELGTAVESLLAQQQNGTRS